MSGVATTGRETGTNRTGPPGGPEEDEEEIDRAEAGSRGTGDHREARAASATGTEAARRQGGGACAARVAVEAEGQCAHRKGGGGHPVAAGIRGIWANAGLANL